MLFYASPSSPRKALRGLRGGEPAMGFGDLRVSVLPGVQRSTPRAWGAHQVGALMLVCGVCWPFEVKRELRPGVILKDGTP